MEKDTLCINLFGGPGVGKSTTAAGVFSLLKLHDIDCELVTEFAKQLVWEERQFEFGDQHYIFGKQHHRMWILNGKIDVILTDSPLLLSAVYRPKSLGQKFIQNVLETFKSYRNLNIILERKKDYNPNGRNETEEQAKEIDNVVREYLFRYGESFMEVPGTFNAVNQISDIVLSKLDIRRQFEISTLPIGCNY